MGFDGIRGHERPIRMLRIMVAGGHVPHAFLFVGPDGIGKRTCALALAQALLCEDAHHVPCDQCHGCRLVIAGPHPDIELIAPDISAAKRARGLQANSNDVTHVHIDQVRAIQQTMAFPAVQGGARVCIIDGAERLTNQAANALLKTLEEPPARTVLVLVATSVALLPVTVLSRCQLVSFAPLDDTHLQQLLIAEGVQPQEAELVCRHAHGSLAQARSLLASDFLSRRRELAVLLAAAGGDRERLVAAAEDLAAQREYLPQVCAFLLEWYRDLLVLAGGGSAQHVLHDDLLDLLEQALQHWPRVRVLAALQALRRLLRSDAFNPDYRVGLEAVFMM